MLIFQIFHKINQSCLRQLNTPQGRSYKLAIQPREELNPPLGNTFKEPIKKNICMKTRRSEAASRFCPPMALEHDNQSVWIGDSQAWQIVGRQGKHIRCIYGSGYATQALFQLPLRTFILGIFYEQTGEPPGS